MNFWKSHFAPLLLLTILCGFLGLLLYSVHAHDGNLANWLQQKSGEVLAALLGTLVPRAVARSADQPNGAKP